MPQWLKEHALLVGLGVVWFLATFYVNGTYMTKEVWAAEQSALMSKLDSILSKMDAQGARDKRNLQIDGLQDSIAACDDEILMLELYVNAAPDADLATARRQRVNQLKVQKERLARELEQVLNDDDS